MCDSKKMIYDDLCQYFSHYEEERLKELHEIWETLFGFNSKKTMNDLTNKLKEDFKDFWEDQIQNMIQVKTTVTKRIEKAGIEALRLEKVLGLPSRVANVENNIPLVEMEDELNKLLSSYKTTKQERIEAFFQLQEREEKLCSVLDLIPEIGSSSVSPKIENEERAPREFIPNSEEMKAFSERIIELENLQAQLEYDFVDYKNQLHSLLEELEISPFTKEERFACDQNVTFPVTKRNLDVLMSSVNRYTKKKEEMIQEADSLREEIASLSRKMFQDPEEIQCFIATNSGHNEPTIKTLKLKQKQLLEERKQKLQELILKAREMLDDLWLRCYYSDMQREEFKPYGVNRWSEEVLEFHEMEIEKLNHFLDENKRIFKLIEQYEEFWTQLLELEEQASNKGRLFNNRGGCLLKEEKARKTIQKKLPSIKAELISLLHNYKAETGKDFTVHGQPLLSIIEQKEMQRAMSKENVKQLRKATNNENLKLESRLGARPVVGEKRAAPMTPQNPNRTKMMRTENLTLYSASSQSTSSGCTGVLVMREKGTLRGATHLNVPSFNFTTTRTPVIKTPVASTPENGSPSYESFQEHIEKSNSKNLCHNSTRNPEQRVLQPKNLNQTRGISERKTTASKATKTPSKIPAKTPTKTPSKIPFRIPTGSRIPSHVPPVSPRKTPTTRNKLPIIF